MEVGWDVFYVGFVSDAIDQLMVWRGLMSGDGVGSRRECCVPLEVSFAPYCLS